MTSRTRKALSDNAIGHTASAENSLHSDGSIVIPDGITLTSFLERNRAAMGEEPSYRFIDYAQNPDGEII